MPRVENEPGNQVLPHGPGTALDLPARPRAHRADGAPGDEQAPAPTTGPRAAGALRAVWVLAGVSLTIGLAALRSLDGSTLAQQSLAAALGVTFAIGISVRSGIQAALAVALALVVGVAAVATQWAPVLAGASVGTAVLAACLAVLVTRPAATLRAVTVEVVLALLLATSGGLAAVGFQVEIDGERFAYTVLGLAMASTVALVYRLAGGLHGLGRRGLILGAGALALLVVVLVYTAALTRYGSPELVRQVSSAQGWTREHLGGVPHPVEVLVGIPALAWGVSMRSRRRQGWWVCAFGAAATAASTTRLVHSGSTPLATGLAAAYSVALGLLLGFLLIRLERVLTGRGGRPARGEPVRRREPPRLHPLH